MKLTSLLLVVLVAAFLSLAAQPKPKTPSRLVLLYTASADGQIRSCNCTKFRFGGYGRELTLLKSIRSKSRDVLLVEGGDICGGTGFQADLKSDAAGKALDLLGYAAFVPGEKELGVRGVRYVDRFTSKAVPAICANLFGADQQQPVYQPYAIVKTAGGLRVALIGLIDGSLCNPWLGVSFGQEAKEPSQVLPGIIKQARNKADLVVLVYHGTVGPDSQVAKLKGIDLVLATHRHSSDRLFPKKDSNTVNAPVGKAGSAVLVNSETSTNWCLGRIDLQLTPAHKIKTAKHTLVYLDRGFKEDPAMVKVYDAYSENVKNAILETSAGFKKNAEAMLAKRGLNLVEMRQRLRKTPFATSEKCKDCHPQIYEIWSSSDHSHAMATLAKTKQEFDPECVHCHATGTTQRNGFTNVKDTPDLANVQCEACHGPALNHMTSPAKGFGKANEETCRSCHTNERTPDFDYSIAWAKIMH
jgi:2',3'-cyclic-nucleotide 2'-phosphodiesterase (5'-nucleotidase family)